MKRHLPRSIRPRALVHDVASASLCLLTSGALAAFSIAGCQSTEDRDLGFTQTARDLGNEPTEPFYSGTEDFVGRWVGRAEEPLALGGDGATIYSFPSGSTQIVLEIAAGVDEFGGPDLSGTLSFGEGTPPPPPTDGSVGYPVGFSYEELFRYDPQFLFNDFTLPPFEGYQYRVVATEAVSSDRLEFPDGVLNLAYSVNEPLDPWCRLQTPSQHLYAPAEYTCVPEYGEGIPLESKGTDELCELLGPDDLSQCPENPTDEELFECLQPGEVLASINCDRLFMCAAGFCSCDAETCRAAGSINSGAEDHLLLRRVGDELVGVFDDTRFVNARNLRLPLGEVRFQRAE